MGGFSGFGLTPLFGGLAVVSQDIFPLFPLSLFRDCDAPWTLVVKLSQGLARAERAGIRRTAEHGAKLGRIAFFCRVVLLLGGSVSIISFVTFV